MDNPSLTRHQRRRQQTRSQLMDAARDLILERGYDAVTIQDITDRADLGRGTFYIHFKDKEETVWAMFHDLLTELEKTAHANVDRTRPQYEYDGFLTIFSHADAHRDLYRMMLGEQGSPRLTARIQDFLAGAFLEDIRSAPPTPEPDFHLPPEFEAQLLTGAVSRLLIWWLCTPTAFSADQMAGMAYSAIYRLPPPVRNLGDPMGRSLLV